jgi:hypothetical protein
MSNEEPIKSNLARSCNAIHHRDYFRNIQLQTRVGTLERSLDFD